MDTQIRLAIAALEHYRRLCLAGSPAPVDRAEIVAHALLSAWAHHWPSQTTPEIRELLSETARIRELERSRWATQRRIAIAKLARHSALAAG